jgi:Domain of unknown function (DUF6968)
LIGRSIEVASVGEVIATRVLRLVGDDSTTEIRVQIGKPCQFPDGRGFYCPYQISGLGNAKVRYAAGIDAVQALQLVMGIIGADLHSRNRSCEGKLRWEGDRGGDLGFPSPV